MIYYVTPHGTFRIKASTTVEANAIFERRMAGYTFSDPDTIKWVDNRGQSMYSENHDKANLHKFLLQQPVQKARQGAQAFWNMVSNRKAIGG